MRSLFGRLLTAQLATVLITLTALGLALSYMYTDYIFELKKRDLVEVGTQLARELGNAAFTPSRLERIKTLLRAAQIYGDAGVLVVSPEGLVLISSASDELTQGLRLSEEDVQTIFSGGTVARRVFLSNLPEPVFAAAVPITTPLGVTGAVVLHAPLRGIMNTVHGGRLLIFWAGILAAGLAVAVSYFFARQVAEPLQQMKAAAVQMAGGDFQQRIQVLGSDEVAELAKAFNDMAATLDTTIHALAAEKSKTESVVAGLTEGVLAIGTDGQVLLVNEAASNLLSPLTLHVGQPLPAARHEESVAHLNDVFEQVMTTSKPTQFSVDTPGRTLLISVSPVSTPGGMLLGSVALLQDVSERHRLEKMRRDFVADVSHELRTPLTSIYGFAQAMLDGVVTSQEQVRRYLRVIMDESLRLVRLTNTLLDLSRIESQRIKLHLEPVFLHEVVTDTLTSLEHQLAEKRISADIQVDSHLPPVCADADRLEQILLNLLDNASRHAPIGGHVQVAAGVLQDQPAQIQVRVSDNGPGIPEDELPFIWERFYKVDKARRQNRKQGTGLGLVIVKQLVELHGGTVEANNMPSGGACFVLTLPVAMPSVPMPQEA